MQPHWDGLNPGKMRAFAPPDKPTMPANARFPALPYFFALILGLLALIGYWYGLGRPVVLPDVARHGAWYEIAHAAPAQNTASAAR